MDGPDMSVNCFGFVAMSTLGLNERQSPESLRGILASGLLFCADESRTRWGQMEPRQRIDRVVAHYSVYK